MFEKLCGPRDVDDGRSQHDGVCGFHRYDSKLELLDLWPQCGIG